MADKVPAMGTTVLSVFGSHISCVDSLHMKQRIFPHLYGYPANKNSWLVEPMFSRHPHGHLWVYNGIPVTECARMVSSKKAKYDLYEEWNTWWLKTQDFDQGNPQCFVRAGCSLRIDPAEPWAPAKMLNMGLIKAAVFQELVLTTMITRQQLHWNCQSDIECCSCNPWGAQGTFVAQVFESPA